MAFFARISDPAIGGTYMTFLNTLTNLGNMWPNSFTLWFVDFLTWKDCVSVAREASAPSAISSTVSNMTSILANKCLGTEGAEECEAMGGSCSTLTDGYFSLRYSCHGLIHITAFLEISF